MIAKLIKLECLDCGWSADASDIDDDYDNYIELEICPRCAKRIAEAI